MEGSSHCSPPHSVYTRTREKYEIWILYSCISYCRHLNVNIFLTSACPVCGCCRADQYHRFGGCPPARSLQIALRSLLHTLYGLPVPGKVTLCFAPFLQSMQLSGCVVCGLEVCRRQLNAVHGRRQTPVRSRMRWRSRYVRET